MTENRTICFLVGAPRSGTTWIQRLLQSHPDICGGEESHFFTLFSHPLRQADVMYNPDRHPDFPSDKHIGPLCYMSRERYEAAFGTLWNEMFRDLYQEFPEARVHLEKSPFHALCLEEIVRIHPRARLIFLVRDSRSVASSLVHAGRSWGDHWAPSGYRAAALEWYRHIIAVQKFRQQHPDQPFLTIRYEDAVADIAPELEKMLRFLLPDTEDLRLTETLETFQAGQKDRKDPKGFSRLRGAQGWKQDMSLYGKLVTWRYTRRKMREFGYDISPFG